MSTTRTLTELETLEFRLASEHGSHVTGPVLPCPLCFQPALRFGADPRPRLASSVREAITAGTRFPEAVAA
jgi:hypothetical protein